MIELLRQTYQGKTILVTGNTGFKGAWLSLWLKTLGAKVIGYALPPPTEPNLYTALGLDKQITQIYQDVRDDQSLGAAFHEHAPQLVFHLAAQSLVGLSYQEPRLTYTTNVLGTVNLLEATRRSEEVRVVVNVTSDKCYENREWPWGYRENDPLGGHDPYSSSKGCAELVNAAYLRSYFSPESFGREHHLALASVRAGNVIGGGDWGPDRLIPDCVRALSNNAEIVLRNPQAIRPWQHVLEALGGYLLLGAKLFTEGARYAGPWNFGPLPGKTWTVEEVVKKIIGLWGHGTYQACCQQPFPEAHWLQLDWSKARMALGWSPRYNLEAALSLTIDWYRQFYGGSTPADLLEFTEAQINRYEELLT